MSGSGQSEQSKKVTHVMLSFDRELTDEEVKQLQMQHKAVSAVRAEAQGDHDHDHPMV